MKKSFLVLLLLVSFCGAVAYAADDPVVAKIGEKKILLSDFNRWFSYDPGAGQKDFASENKMKATMLHQIVTAMVISDIARKEGFDKRPDIREKTDFVVNNLLTIEYLDKVVSAQVKASDEEIKAYYEANKDSYRTKELLRGRHILIKAEKNATEAEKQAARKKAEEVLIKVRAGGDFSALAVEFSDDPGSKERGGNLGWFSRGQMAPEFEKAAFSLAPGGVSDIVETKFGYHIIKVEERKDPTLQPLDEVRGQIELKLTRDKRRKAVEDYVQKAMKDAGASVNVEPVVGPDPHFTK